MALKSDDFFRQCCLQEDKKILWNGIFDRYGQKAYINAVRYVYII